MNSRKLQALRNLAERPGTEAEGRLAREILARIEAKRGDEPDGEASAFQIYRDLECGVLSTEQFIDALRRYVQRK